jgi:hypothetical protein
MRRSVLVGLVVLGGSLAFAATEVSAQQLFAGTSGEAVAGVTFRNSDSAAAVKPAREGAL